MSDNDYDPAGHLSEPEKLEYWLRRAQMLKALLDLPSIPWPALKAASGIGDGAKMSAWREKGLRFFKHGNEYHTTPANYAAVVQAMELGVNPEALQRQAATNVPGATPPSTEPARPLESEPWFHSEFWTKDEAATYLRKSVRSIDRLISARKLTVYKRGGDRPALKAAEVKRLGSRAG